MFKQVCSGWLKAIQSIRNSVNMVPMIDLLEYLIEQHVWKTILNTLKRIKLFNLWSAVLHTMASLFIKAVLILNFEKNFGLSCVNDFCSTQKRSNQFGLFLICLFTFSFKRFRSFFKRNLIKTICFLVCSSHLASNSICSTLSKLLQNVRNSWNRFYHCCHT